MAGRLKDIVANDVKSLIKQLTGLEEYEDNFKTCERYMLSNIIHHRYLSVDSHALSRSVDGIVCKLRFHGLFEKADKLDELVKAFLAIKEYKDHPTVDVQWAILSFLLHSANKPSETDHLEEGNVTDENTLDVSLDSPPTADEVADWEAYLREGEAEFRANWSDCSLSGLSDSDSDFELGVSSLAKLDRNNEKSFTVSSIPPSPSKKISEVTVSTDTRQQRKKFFHQAAEAEKWCRENLQSAWWTEAHPKHEPTSTDPSSRLAFLWDESEEELSSKQDKSKPVVTDTVSEHKAVLELLWSLASPCASPLFFATADSGSITYSVRPNITVPSLTKDVFYDLMSELCSYFGMIKSLQDFSRDVLSCELSQLPSTSYNAYASAIRKAMQPLLDQIIELEKLAHKQETSLSLIKVVQLLRPRLKDLETIYDLHKRAVLPWNSNPNWLCAIHILAVLLSEISSAKQKTPLILPIAVSTLQGYVDIADLWLATGVLDDSRDEFFILKSAKDDDMGAMLSMRPWEEALRQRNIPVPETMKNFATKMMSVGRDIEILRRMDRLREVWEITPTRGNFVKDVLRTFNKTVKNYIIEDNEPKESVAEDEMTTSAITEPLTPRIPMIPSHLRTLNDPFLGILVLESLRGSENSQKARSPGDMYTESVSKVSKTFPLSLWMSECITAQLDERWKCAQIGSTAANILINELKLDRHVRFAQALLLMQAGNILEPFCKILFKQADREMKLSNGVPSSWDGIYSLSVILEDSIDAEHQDLSSRCSLSQRPIVFKEKRSPAITDTLETLELGYSVDWPLTLVLSPQNIERYNEIFRLLLKIKFGVWALLQMRFSDVRAHCDHPLIKRVMHLRVWLLHALRNSFTFLAGQILNNLWESFLKKMKAAKDFESIVRAHHDFLDAAHEQCLQPSKPDVIKNSLIQMVVIADKLRALWIDSPENISNSRLTNMEKCYIDCHAYLAEFLSYTGDENKHLAYLYEVFAHDNPLHSILASKKTPFL